MNSVSPRPVLGTSSRLSTSVHSLTSLRWCQTCTDTQHSRAHPTIRRMTYSVVAFDPESDSYGVAAQSHSFNIGVLVPWARSGVGAIATQATTNTTYGRRGLEMLAAGVDPETTLVTLLDEDSESSIRQVAIVGSEGEVAVHTGSSCLRHASHITGPTWSVQGNLLANESVVPAMAEAYGSSSGPLAQRLLAALTAAEEAGGDLRGPQSAHILVVSGPNDEPDETIDVGVADHPDPVGELWRLVELDSVAKSLRGARRAVRAGDTQQAVRLVDEIPERHDHETDFWKGMTLAGLGRWDEALTLVTDVLDSRPVFADVLDRLAERDPVAADVRRRLDI